MFESHSVTFRPEAEISSDPRMRNETFKNYSTEGECYHAEVLLFMPCGYACTSVSVVLSVKGLYL